MQSTRMTVHCSFDTIELLNTKTYITQNIYMYISHELIAQQLLGLTSNSKNRSDFKTYVFDFSGTHL